MENTFFKSAQAIVDRGLSVIPVKARAKTPLAGALSRSRDKAQLAVWAAQYPDANVGIVADENYTILETDDWARFEQLIESEAGQQLPHTLCLSSGRPGRRAWIYKRTAACGEQCLEVPGVFEFRNRNQYVVGPGSTHPEGHKYRWVDESEPIAMPDWLLEALKKADAVYVGKAKSEHLTTGPAQQLKDAYLRRLDPQDMLDSDVRISTTERHYALMSIAGFLNDGERSPEDIARILCDIRDQLCDSPEDKGDSEIFSMAEYVHKKEPFDAEPTELPSFSDGTTIFATAEGLAEHLKKKDEIAASSWRGLFHTYEEAMNAPPLSFAINGFLQQDGITFLGGLPAHGKTLIMLNVVKSLLEGTPLFGYPEFSVDAPAQRVIYLVPESGLGPFVHRLKLFRLMNHVRDGRLLFRTMNKGEVMLNDLSLLKAVAGADVFLDTAVRFFSGNENDASDNREFAKLLFGLQTAGARTVVGAHHSPKQFESVDHISLENALRGSGDIGAMVSAAWGIKRVDEENTRIYVKNIKARDFEACQPFEVAARPYLNENGNLRMVGMPGLTKPPARGPNPKGLDMAKEMRKSGKSLADIADSLGVATRTVERWSSKGYLPTLSEPDPGRP